MPKSFLVKNKKTARRTEDGEVLEDTMSAQREENSSGETMKNRTSFKSKILFIPCSTWPFDKRFCSQFLPNISCVMFTVIKCHRITGADVGGRTVP